MKRFKFRFDTVEKIRRNREQQVLRLFGAALRDLERCKGYKKSLQNKLENGKIEREQLGSRPTSPAQFGVLDSYIRGTEQRIIQTNQAISRAEKALEKARRVYLQARKNLKVIETLREKHFEEWKRERQKLEQKRIEDIVNTRAAINKEEVA